jgi:hypothetical protein
MIVGLPIDEESWQWSRRAAARQRGKRSRTSFSFRRGTPSLRSSWSGRPSRPPRYERKRPFHLLRLDEPVPLLRIERAITHPPKLTINDSAAKARCQSPDRVSSDERTKQAARQGNRSPPRPGTLTVSRNLLNQKPGSGRLEPPGNFSRFLRILLQSIPSIPVHKSRIKAFRPVGTNDRPVPRR